MGNTNSLFQQIKSEHNDKRALLEYETAIGYELLQLLPQLKVNKFGRINTDRGIKTVSGLGACILSIIEAEKLRLSE